MLAVLLEALGAGAKWGWSPWRSAPASAPRDTRNGRKWSWTDRIEPPRSRGRHAIARPSLD